MFLIKDKLGPLPFRYVLLIESHQQYNYDVV